jgi:hypothetical protein
MCKAFFYGCYVCNSVVKFYRRANLVCLGILSLHSVLNLRACCGGPDAAVNMIVCFIMANRRIASYVLAHMAL